MLLLAAPILFSDSSVTGNYQFSFLLNKTVDVGVSAIFTDISGNRITEKAVDLTKGLEKPQIQLMITTNRTQDYTLKLTFGAMRIENDTTWSFIGQYGARVSDIYDTETTRNAVFESTSSTSTEVSFPGDTTRNASITISQSYPIAFDFSNYIENYGAGSFIGTITLEIET